MTEQMVLFSPRFLDQHAGSVLRDPTIAMIELVANSWDAGASRVEIDWPDADAERPFRIRDNGHGMTADEFDVRWRTLSYDRATKQGASAEFPEEADDRSQRRAFGRNGIGRHGVFCFGDAYELRTWTGGRFHRYAVKRGTAVPLEIDLIEEGVQQGHGTDIVVTEPRFPRMEADQARTEIGLRFLTDPQFEVFVDGEQVHFSDIPERQLGLDTLHVSGVGAITIRLLDTRMTDKTSKQHGIAWHVGGRLVGECSWFGTGHERFLDGRRSEARQYTFIVEADPLEFAVREDWSGFDTAHPSFRNANEAVQARIGDWLIELTKEKRAETTSAVRYANRSTLAKVGPRSREKWETFVDRAQQECPSISERELKQLASLLAKLEASQSEYKLIEQLHRLETSDLDQLHEILRDWSVETAKIVLDELRFRLKLLHELERKVRSSETAEVQELQPLFHRGLWIFGPEFETIEFTSNQGMTRVVQELFGSNDRASLRRPDFAILPDGTSGFYAYPKYDAQGAEIGTQRLVVVELKRPGLRISTEEKAQPWKYVKELVERGHVTRETSTTCFVLGSELDPAEAGERTEMNGSVRVQPLTYETVIERAKSRLLRLSDRVREAPFLQGVDVAAYLTEDPEELTIDLFEAGERPTSAGA